ncbi:MAG TPA: hypothetical protein PLK08_01040 [Phycisphaerae bacterium]|nr:hypothetical protein [Phycisphaerae bacterium]
MSLEVPAGIGGRTEEVAPDAVDSTILNTVKQIETAIQNAKAPELEMRNYVDTLKAQQNDFLQNDVLASVDFGSPKISGMIQRGKLLKATEQVDLAKVQNVMPAPAKPFDWTGLELRLVESAGTEENNSGTPSGTLAEEPVWRGVDCYPIAELDAAWRKALEKTVIVPQIVAVKCEVEFEELAADGHWLPVNDIQTFRLPVAAVGDANQPARAPVIPDYVEAQDGTTNLQNVQQAISDMRNWMIEELQPEYYKIWSREGQISWQQHMPLEKISALFEEKSSASTPAVPAAAATNRSRYNRNVMAAEMGMMGEMTPNQPTYASRQRNSEATDDGSIPNINSQLEAGKLLAWFHAKNLKFGKKYRCRFRWLFVNPLLTYTKSVKPEDIKDATTVKTVASPWSPWSDTVAVSRKMEFFLTGANDQRKEVTVTVFTEAMGQLVRARFNRIQAGQPIGGESEVSVVNPLSGEREKMAMNFQTGAIVIELNFNRRFITSFGRVKKDAVEMVYLDVNGNVQSRIRENDLLLPKYRSMTQEAQAGEPEVEKVVREEKERTSSGKTKKTTTKIVPIEPQMPGEIMPNMPKTRKIK